MSPIWCSSADLSNSADADGRGRLGCLELCQLELQRATAGDQVRAAGNGKLLTVLAPLGDGHCNFTDAQISTAFRTLVRRADTGGR